MDTEIIPADTPFSWGCLPSSLQTLTAHQAAVAGIQTVLVLLAVCYVMLAFEYFRRWGYKPTPGQVIRGIQRDNREAKEARRAEAEQQRQATERYNEAIRQEAEQKRREAEAAELWEIQTGPEAREYERQRRVFDQQYRRGVRELRRADWWRRCLLLKPDWQVRQDDRAVLLFLADQDGLSARNAVGRVIKVRRAGRRFPASPFVVSPSAHMALDVETGQPVEFVDAGQVAPVDPAVMTRWIKEAQRPREVEVLRRRAEFFRAGAPQGKLARDSQISLEAVLGLAGKPISPDNVFEFDPGGTTARNHAGQAVEFIGEFGEGKTFVVDEPADMRAEAERRGQEDRWSPGLIRRSVPKANRRPSGGPRTGKSHD